MFFGLVLECRSQFIVQRFRILHQSQLRGTAYGVGFLMSGGIYGLLMDFNAPFTVTLLLVVVVQTVAVIALLHTSSAPRKQA